MDASFRIAADAIIEASKRRCVSLRAAQDLIDGSVLTRAFADFAARPGQVNSWPNGHGTGRRAIDHEAFIKAVADYAASKQPRAAA